jgi:hypothetical protein
MGVFRNPRLGMSNSPGTHAGAGMDQMIDKPHSIRYNMQTLYPGLTYEGLSAMRFVQNFQRFFRKGS